MYDTIIIGAGIAGLTAAIYAARKRMKFILLSTDFGGQFRVSGEVLNYPGIVKTTGVEFAQIMKEQIDFNQIEVKNEIVSTINQINSNFKVISDKGEYDTQTVIIATGARARKLGVTGEEEFANKGVTYCALCDGPLFAGKDIAIIGGGDSALEAVDFMKDIAENIYLVQIKDSFTAHEYLQEKIQNNPKVEVLLKTKTTEILGDKFVTGIKVVTENEERILNVGGVIIEIGRTPNTEPFKDILAIDKNRHILIDCQTRTSIPGIFAAGDCASGLEYQYVIAAGQGCMALIKVARYLALKKEGV